MNVILLIHVWKMELEIMVLTQLVCTRMQLVIRLLQVSEKQGRHLPSNIGGARDILGVKGTF